MPGDRAWLFQLFFGVLEGGGFWLFQLWVLIVMVGLPAYVAVPISRRKDLDVISRTLLVGVAVLIPVPGPITASVLAGRADKQV